MILTRKKKLQKQLDTRIYKEFVKIKSCPLLINLFDMFTQSVKFYMRCFAQFGIISTI